MDNKKSRSRSCPQCSSNEVVPISYGLPLGDAIKDAEAGKIWLGGCIVTDEDPEWHCKDCGNEWR